MTWARCAACGETFGSDSAFDRHRIKTTGKPGYDPEYDWRCATPAEIQAKGYHRDARGRWRAENTRRAIPPSMPAPGAISRGDP